MNIRKTGRTLISITGLLVTGLLLTGPGHAVSGVSKGSLSESLSVTDCGYDSDVINYRVKLKKGGKWTGTFDGLRYYGKYTQRLKGRRLKLTFFKKSRARFVDKMEDWSSELCGTKVNISKVAIKIRLKLNKKRTLLRGTVTANGTGRSVYGAGQGTYTGDVSGNWKR